jgi:dienelactone hydrolase
MRSISRLAVLFSAAIATLLTATLPGWTQVPEGDPTDGPVVSAAVPPGTGAFEALPVATPGPRIVDGDISDWTGEATSYGGTSVVSDGELIYQDHIFDAHGPDDGRDARRYENTDQAEDVIPQAYRIDSLAQADLRGELGAPIPDQFAYDDSVGDAASHQDNADLVEVRVALRGNNLLLLARTTTLTAPDQTALVLLADTIESSEVREVGFNSGLTTSTGDFAVFLSNAAATVTNLADGESKPLAGGQVAVNADGFTNAIEARIPLNAIGGDQGLRLALAAGTLAGSGDSFADIALDPGEGDLDPVESAIDAANPPDAKPQTNVANVAFRYDEPVRMWFEKQQGLALNAGTIDPFFTDVDAAKLRAGVSERYVPGPGYHDRIFESTTTPAILQESGRNGLFQHYGIYLPASFNGDPMPLQLWLHWRGGFAHSGAAVVPKVFKQFGEDKDTIVVAPSGRGTSTWYVGRGHVDFQEVWSDVMDSYPIDRDHVYVTGHSMGGWGSYLLTLLYPDRFAAAAPVAGPVTQGAWTGADFDGCDEFSTGEYSPCFIAANDSRPRDQFTRKLLRNALHVPYAILHGTSDELVFYSGVARQAEELANLGYRFRFYTYPGYEHYSHPIMDQWSEAARYLHTFSRDPNPAHVVYKRDMPFEVATEEVQSGGADLDFSFDSAYWMSGLSPVDDATGIATFDGRSLAIPETPHLAVPDTGAPTSPGQTGPYTITGLQWTADPTAAVPVLSNAFEAILEGADAVTLDVDRMALDTASSITGSVSTEAPLALGFLGDWAAAPTVTVDGTTVPTALDGKLLTVDLPAGDHEITIVP